MRRTQILSGIFFLLIAACGGGDDDDSNKAKSGCTVGSETGCAKGLVCQAVAGGAPACFCNPDAQTGCAENQACEAVSEGNTACFAPITVQGKVFDLASHAPIAGAHVVARDVNAVAVSGIAVTDANGDYSLKVPTTRDKAGKPVENRVTLRADAAAYLTFPAPPRVALPFDVAAATGDPPILKSSVTDIGLIAIPDATGLGTVSGHVIATAPLGTLVVAGGSAHQGGGVSGVADRDGSYTVFNVPAGSVSVHGYKLGLELTPVTANVTNGAETSGVDLHSPGAAAAVVSGKIDLVDPGAGSVTSVILAVDETFNETSARGEAPPGFRAGNVTSTFSISGVPSGNYVVLAAFENDQLVRDPDQSIGGTKIVRVTVSGANVDLTEAFKVTGALDVASPDKEAEVSGTPTFVWADDAGEDHYDLQVFDAFGTEIWKTTGIHDVPGSHQIKVVYGGRALTPGLLYQFRATSIKLSGSPISMTEDLRGTFFYK